MCFPTLSRLRKIQVSTKDRKGRGHLGYLYLTIDREFTITFDVIIPYYRGMPCNVTVSSAYGVLVIFPATSRMPVMSTRIHNCVDLDSKNVHSRHS